MIKKIMVATDGSELAEKAAAYAIDMAKQLQGELLALFVMDDSRDPVLSSGLEIPFRDLQKAFNEKLSEIGEEAIARVREMGKEKGVKVSGKLIGSSSAVQGIIEAAKEEKVDLIVVGSHGRTHFLDVPVGNVTRKLVSARKPCPVMVVPVS
ncbi:putative universal stress protein [bacterium BMS3Bbin14]|nr:putative universal stress protein [bacterium BMS3Abin13]GBE52171.1 putative universal stress protein [bacterium BMS3Bbin14]